MTLLVTCVAASVTTTIWYCSERARKLRIGTLALIYWGAALMWLVDEITAWVQEGADFLQACTAHAAEDTLIGLSVTVLAFVIWIISLLIHNPEGLLRDRLTGKS